MAVITKEIEAERAATGVSSSLPAAPVTAGHGDLEMGNHTTATAQDVK